MDLFQPAALVHTMGYEEIVSKCKTLAASLRHGERMTLEKAIELGGYINHLIQTCDHGRLLKSYEDMGLQQQRASEYARIAKLPDSVLSLCESITDAQDAIRRDSCQPQGNARSSSTTKAHRDRATPANAQDDPEADCQQTETAKSSTEMTAANPTSTSQSSTTTRELTLAEQIEKRASSFQEWAFKAFSTRIPFPKSEHAKERFKVMIDFILKTAADPFLQPEDTICKRCKAKCMWVTTAGHSRMLINSEPRVGGRFELIKGLAVYVEFDKNEKRYARHECPNSKEVF